MTVALIDNPSQRLAYARPLAHLLRPGNLVIITVGVLLGGVLGAGPAAVYGSQALWLWAAAISAAFVAAGGNCINDYFDVDIDRVNRPDRPLPSGRLMPHVALIAWVLFSAAGIALGAVLSPVHAFISVVAVALLYLYSRYWKRSVFVGNLMVSVLIATVLVYGGWAVSAPGAAALGALFALLTTLAREIVKDIQDISGDAAVDAKTLAVVYGPRRAAAAASLVLAATVLATPVPYLVLGYGGLYLLTVILADGLMLRALWLLQAPSPERTAGKVSRLLKMAMLVGIGALAVAAI